KLISSKVADAVLEGRGIFEKALQEAAEKEAAEEKIAEEKIAEEKIAEEGKEDIKEEVKK
ncbi:MAG: 30S ribosomal protein S2, partial [Candidatus Mariimomonas ferrooxydans]